MKKFFQHIIVTAFLLVITVVPAHAQQFSLIPGTTKGFEECVQFMNQFQSSADQTKMLTGNQRNDILACGIQTGRISFSMFPYFITYIINFLLGFAGLISVLFIVIGGYHYVIGGLTEEKETGKKTITNALMGLGVALIAWTAVNVIIRAVTG